MPKQQKKVNLKKAKVKKLLLGNDEITSVQKKIGYVFVNRNLLALACTHRSKSSRNNERLEFLGDSLLGFVIGQNLYSKFPKASEGDLSRMRARLVRNQNLAKIACDLNLQDYLLLGDAARNSNAMQNVSILADTMEAMFGAIYLDSDFTTAKKVILNIFKQSLKNIANEKDKDAKTKLQELLQKNSQPPPQYKIIAQTGEAHAPKFKVACDCSGLKKPLVAIGSSRREAEQYAAELVLAKLIKK